MLRNKHFILLSFLCGWMFISFSVETPEGWTDKNALRSVHFKKAKPRPPKRTLVGKYQNTGMFSFEQFIFCEDLSFSYQEESCGMKFIGEGNYVLTRDSLFLLFDSPLEKAIAYTSEALEDTSQLSTVGIFRGHTHRNDILFDYTIVYKDSTRKEGIGNCYHPLTFDPDSVSSIVVTTFLQTSDTLISHETNQINITSEIPHRYTLLERSDPSAMYLGPMYNKRYKIKLNRERTRFRLRRRDQESEYQLISH